MDYALNEMDAKHGTHIFIGDLKTENDESFELRKEDSDICFNSKQLDILSQTSWLVENSLAQFIRYMYLRHPAFLYLSINGSKVERQTNPFNTLMVKST